MALENEFAPLLRALLVAAAAAAACAAASYDVSTLAGGAYGSADGVGAAAGFASPLALALAPSGDAVFVAEQGNHRIRVVYRNGTVGTLAGGGASGFLSGFADGNKTAALFYLMQALAAPPPGTSPVAVYVSEFGNYKVRAVAPNGTTRTLAGGGASGKSAGTADGVGTNAGFTTPNGVALYGSSLFVADGTRLRAIELATGAVTTLAGTTTAGFANGAGAAAAFRGLAGLAVLPATGTLVVAETWYYDVRAVETSTGVARAFVGGGSQDSVDGVGAAARFRVPAGVFYDAGAARLLLADTGGSRVIAIDPVTLSATTLFGGTSGFANGDGASAAFANPSSAVAFPDGAIVIADQSNHAVRIAVPVSASPSPSGAPPSASPSNTPTPSASVSAAGASASPTGTPSASPTSSPSGSLTVSSSPTVSVTGTPTSSGAVMTTSPPPASPTPSSTTTPSPSPSLSPSSSPSPSQTPEASVSPTCSVSESSLPAASASAAPSDSTPRGSETATAVGSAAPASSSALSSATASASAGLGDLAGARAQGDAPTDNVALEAVGGAFCVALAGAAALALRRRQRRSVFSKRGVGEVLGEQPVVVAQAPRPVTSLSAPFVSSSRAQAQAPRR